MLNQYQKQIIRTAVAKASDKTAEIKKLSAGMKVSVEEIQSVLDREDAVKNAAHSMAPQPKAENPTPSAPDPISDHPQKPRGSQKGRMFWTTEMVQQLENLRKKGETFPRIAEIMGLDVKQVVNKAHRKPDLSTVNSMPEQKQKSEKAAEPSENVENHNAIDMPGAVQGMINTVHNMFSGNIICIHASNDENYAAVEFMLDGTTYDLRLEVMG